ncbi:alpha/beta fold hydrolase [Chondromyces crocatus]|uniref:Alpha/beta hydrolase n=1 Tax=Chondromyces crocatus TaxID=52 RepID=A0A0K1EB57_CHOCO|nr:alpha/beta hydrolase [Chondromyces crocatus]AKT37927.1 alpha/beta hydrolase [Chondromyces crocatus]
MTDPTPLQLSRIDRGHGTPVLLVHSSGMSSRQWTRLVDRLADHHRAIAPDLLGYGKNPPWPADQPFDLRLDRDAIAALATELGGPVHLVGHSYGALIALLVAMETQVPVRSLSLFEPVAFGILHATADQAGLADLDTAQSPAFLDETTGGDEAWLNAFIDYWSGPGAWNALPATARNEFLRVGRKAFLEVRSLMHLRAPLDAFRAIRTPTLLLTGSASTVAARRVAVQLAEHLPAAELQILDDVGHMGPLTHADLVNARIRAHIERVEAAG